MGGGPTGSLIIELYAFPGVRCEPIGLAVEQTLRGLATHDGQRRPFIE